MCACTHMCRYLNNQEHGHGILQLKGSQRIEGKWEAGGMTHIWRFKELVDAEAHLAI